MKVKKFFDTAIIPTKGSSGAAGYDLYANISDGSEVINPHENKKISTGLGMEIPYGYAGLIFARSGLATKRGLRPANCVGVVDSDYRGEVIVALHNDSDEVQQINHGDRIAQLVIVPYATVLFEVVDDLENTERGEGGFGSTGTAQ
jgi:dUTP pyrophosphatase